MIRTTWRAALGAVRGRGAHVVAAGGALVAPQPLSLGPPAVKQRRETHDTTASWALTWVAATLTTGSGANTST